METCMKRPGQIGNTADNYDVSQDSPALHETWTKRPRLIENGDDLHSDMNGLNAADCFKSTASVPITSITDVQSDVQHLSTNRIVCGDVITPDVANEDGLNGAECNVTAVAQTSEMKATDAQLIVNGNSDCEAAEKGKLTENKIIENVSCSDELRPASSNQTEPVHNGQNNEDLSDFDLDCYMRDLADDDDDDDFRTEEEKLTQRNSALKWLQQAVGKPDADFHQGQWEAIDAVANRHKRVLVVQRTGWGKSSVYFIATRILREEQKRGPTLIISPLLALMRNQMEAATKLGIISVTLNSTNQKEWDSIIERVLENKVDVLLLSPERLASDNFKSNVLSQIINDIGMLVIDEVHCVSVWGHDFRPDYRRIKGVIDTLPPEIPLLGTTATANESVLSDCKALFGGDVRIQRGSLLRPSLSLNVVHSRDTASRLAWLATNLRNTPPGLSGIIYTNTRHDADLVANWLMRNTEFRTVYAYYSGVKARRGLPGLDAKFCHDSDAYRSFLEKCLVENKLKALVATTALGMGFDKPDLGFVIHYQTPDSIVTYYQQVGRAGRGIDSAIGVLMSSEEDEKIHKQLSETAFPSKEQIDSLLDALSGTSADGYTMEDILERCNLRYGQIEKALRFLAAEDDAPVCKILKPSVDMRERWIRNPLDIGYNTDNERVRRKISQRADEWQEMKQFFNTSECLMLFIRRSLGDLLDCEPCGKCSSCITTEFTFDEPSAEMLEKAADYVRNADIDLVCRKQVPPHVFKIYRWNGFIPRHLQARDGKILSLLNDGGWGTMVAEDRARGRYRDELVLAMARLLKERWRPSPMPAWVTYVPTARKPDPVGDFARRLAQKLNIPFMSSVQKTRETRPQSQMLNRVHQCCNVDGAFKIQGKIQSGPCLLVDDLVDSGWTMTVVSALLMQKRSGPVMPMALARVNVGT